MKKINSKNAKNLAIGSVVSLSLIAPSFFSCVSYASEINTLEDKNIKVSNIKENGNDISMRINFKQQNEIVDMKIKQIDENNMEVYTTTNSGESHYVTANKNDDFFIMDGEKIPVNKTTVVEKDELAISEKAARGAWDPVYVSTGKVEIGNTIASVGALCTIIGAGIVIASLAGVSITSASITSTVSNWASMIGLGSLVAGFFFRGDIKYKLYKTKSPVKPPTGTLKTAYRFQDVRSVGTIKGKNMNLLLKSAGSWWW